MKSSLQFDRGQVKVGANKVKFENQTFCIKHKFLKIHFHSKCVTRLCLQCPEPPKNRKGKNEAVPFAIYSAISSSKINELFLEIWYV